MVNPNRRGCGGPVCPNDCIGSFARTCPYYKRLDARTDARTGLPLSYRGSGNMVINQEPEAPYRLPYEEAVTRRPEGVCYCDLDDRACYEAGHWSPVEFPDNAADSFQ